MVASGKMLTRSWAYSIGHPTSDQRLKAARPYALLCTWTYLNDQGAAHDLMDHAVQKGFDDLGRQTDCRDKKLSWRIMQQRIIEFYRVSR